MDDETKDSAPFVVPSELLTLQERCYDHAADLLRAAQALRTEQGLPHVAYHLAVVALEEIGKAELLGMDVVAEGHGEESRWKSRLDDHEQKLFFALWTPSFGAERITGDLLRFFKSHASDIHEARLQALYVDPRPSSPAPRDAIPDDETEAFLKLVEERLKLARARRPRASFDERAKEDIRWFIEATADSRRRHEIASGESMEKLAEVRDVALWIRWLRERQERVESESRELLRQELARVVPRLNELGEPKWRLRVRLSTSSHSVRPKPLAQWNEWASRIKLRPVADRKDTLDVEFILLSHTTVEQLWPMGWGLIQCFAASLNIATAGLFWWYLPYAKPRFYETLTDLSTGRDLIVEPQDAAPPEAQRRVALGTDELRRAAVFFGALSPLLLEPEGEHFRRYLTGLALAAKCDLYVRLEYSAYSELLNALRVRLRACGEWTGEEDTFAGAYRGFLARLLHAGDGDTAEEVDKQVHLAERVLADRESPRPTLILDDVLKMKLFCDSLFSEQLTQLGLEKRAKLRAHSSPSDQSTT